MKIYIILMLVIFSGCSLLNRHTLFFGEIESINLEPLEVDGEAEVVVRIGETETITFFVASCNPPIVCSKETVNLISSESLQRGSKVKISAYLWKHPKGSKYIIEQPSGYIRKI
jgi:hypothetical protein